MIILGIDEEDIFLGLGDKVLRGKYTIARLAFVRAMFKLSNFSEVPLYRGMSREIDFYETPISLISATFSSDVAKALAGLNDENASRSSYYLKFTYPVDNLFMTFFETAQFNERYKEQEAIIIYRQKIRI